MPVRRGSLLATLVAIVVLGSGVLPSSAQGVEEELKSAGDRASAALQRVTEARAAYDQATAKAHEVRLRLDERWGELAKVGTKKVDSTRERLRGYVAALFRDEASGLGAFGPLLTAEDPVDLINRAGLLEVTNSRQGEVLAALTAHRARADKLAAETAQLVDDLAALEQKAADSLAAAEAAMREAETLVARAHYDVASREGARLAAAIAATRGGARTLVIPEFPGRRRQLRRQVDRRLPQRADSNAVGLCPLWGTAGMSLRGDAAAAFNRMSRGFGQIRRADLRH